MHGEAVSVANIEDYRPHAVIFEACTDPHCRYTCVATIPLSREGMANECGGCGNMTAEAVPEDEWNRIRRNGKLLRLGGAK